MFKDEKKLVAYTKDLWAESIYEKIRNTGCVTVSHGERVEKNYELATQIELQMGQEIWLISSITVTTVAKRKAQMCFTSYEKIANGKKRSNNRHPKYTMLSAEQLQSLYKQM